jgi:hypothetical protein
MRIFREPLLYLLPVLVLFWFFLNQKQAKIEDVEFTYDGNTESAKLPIIRNLPEADFKISFNILVLKSNASKYRVIPDDCIRKITINGKDMPLDGIKGLCNLDGITMNFDEYISIGNNKFEFVIHNNGGPAGLKLEQMDNSGFIPKAVFLIVLFAIISLFLKKFKFGFRASIVILLGIAIRLIFYNGTSVAELSYDFNDHIKYIQIINEEKRIPNLDECWSCYHSPVFYVTSAALKKITDIYDENLFYNVLRQTQLLFSFFALAFGVALLFRIFENKTIAFIASLLWVFWPGFIIASVRVSNDIPFYFGAMFCMYFAELWWKRPKNSYLVFATLGASLAFAFKSTGFVVLGVWGIIFVCGIFKHFKMCSLKVIAFSIIIVLAFIAVSQHRTIKNVFEGKKLSLVGNSSGLNSGLNVKNEPGNYMYFDLENFLTEPYTSPWNDKQGRQYFWNYAFKTSLFGEFRVWDSKAGKVLASLISLLTLISIALALWGLIHLNLKEFPLFLFLLALFAALMYARIQYPYSCSNDFRYIIPVLLPLSYFSIKGIQILNNGRLKILGYSSIILFSLLSLIFILGRAFAV